MIKNGDYVIENGEMLLCDYVEELVQNIKIILETRRGGFYPDCAFGSVLNELGEEPLDFYALAAARQALAGLDGVFVKSAEVGDSSIVFNLIINGEERQVTTDR